MRQTDDQTLNDSKKLFMEDNFDVDTKGRIVRFDVPAPARKTEKNIEKTINKSVETFSEKPKKNDRLFMRFLVVIMVILGVISAYEIYLLVSQW